MPTSTNCGPACAPVGREAEDRGRARGDGHQRRVVFHPRQQIVGRQVGIVGSVVGSERAERDGVERGAVVIGLLVGLGRRKALALDGVDVHHHGVVNAAHLGQRADERAEVVAVGHVAVVEAQGAEEVAGRLSAGAAQLGQAGIHAAVVLGNRHLIVVEQDDEIGAQFGRIVEPLESLAAAERAVAQHGNDVLGAAQQVAPLGQAAGKADGRRRVAYHKVVVLALGRLRIARHGVEGGGVGEGVAAAGEHLVDVALVRHVEDDAVGGRIEDVVQGHGGLDHSEVGAAVAAAGAQPGHEGLARLGTQPLELRQAQTFEVGGRIDVFEIHDDMLFGWLRLDDAAKLTKRAPRPRDYFTVVPTFFHFPRHPPPGTKKVRPGQNPCRTKNETINSFSGVEPRQSSVPSMVRMLPSGAKVSGHTLRLRSHDLPPEGTLSWWNRYHCP